MRFEVKAIFCSAFGPNIRSEVAHGLLEEGACNSVFGVYAWWFIFRIVFANFWNDKPVRRHQMDEESSHAEQSSVAAPESGAAAPSGNAGTQID